MSSIRNRKNRIVFCARIKTDIKTKRSVSTVRKEQSIASLMQTNIEPAGIKKRGAGNHNIRKGVAQQSHGADSSLRFPAGDIHGVDKGVSSDLKVMEKEKNKPERRAVICVHSISWNNDSYKGLARFILRGSQARSIKEKYRLRVPQHCVLRMKRRDRKNGLPHTQKNPAFALRQGKAGFSI